jgi:hypothetical protein
MNKKEIFVKDFIAIHGNKYDYTFCPDKMYVCLKIKIMCNVHGIFEQRAGWHLRGQGCKICGQETTQAKRSAKREIITKKTKQTKLERYGDENYTNIEKTKQTNLERYGYDNPFKDPIIAKAIGLINSENEATRGIKRKKTNLAKYGVFGGIKHTDTEYPCQNANIYEKSAAESKKSKLYTFPSGNTYNVQGYEPQAITLLLEQGYTENDLVLKNRPSIKYFWSDKDGYGDNQWHIYHPDIFIPKENKIIEVKSDWTYDGCKTNPKLLSKNLAKRSGCELSGYNFEFIVL